MTSRESVAESPRQLKKFFEVWRRELSVLLGPRGRLEVAQRRECAVLEEKGKLHPEWKEQNNEKNRKNLRST